MSRQIFAVPVCNVLFHDDKGKVCQTQLLATKQQPHHEDQPQTRDTEQDQVPRYKTVTTQS